MKRATFRFVTFFLIFCGICTGIFMLLTLNTAVVKVTSAERDAFLFSKQYQKPELCDTNLFWIESQNDINDSSNNNKSSLHQKLGLVFNESSNVFVDDVAMYPDALLPRYPRNVSELEGRIVPNNVFYVWCGQSKTFEYRHYVNILSIWMQLEPDVIEIRYDALPLEDKYNTWLSRLRAHIPVLNLSPLPDYAKGDNCGTIFGLELVLDRGGIFIDNECALFSKSTEIFNAILKLDAQIGFFPDNTIAWVSGVRKSKLVQGFLEKLSHKHSSLLILDKIAANPQKIQVPFTICNEDTFSEQQVLPNQKAHSGNDSLHWMNSTRSVVNCIRFRKDINPITFWKSLGNYCNSSSDINTIISYFKTLIFDGSRISSDSTSDMESFPSYISKTNMPKRPIPRIVHYVWFGKNVLTLSMYLSFLSTANIVRPNVILIHTDMLLEGPFWDLICQNRLVLLVYREAPRTVYGQKVLYTQHRSDVVRADILENYGGVYLDWDAFWLKPIDALLESQHDVTISRDHIPRPPFPDTINMGVVLARPRSAFIRLWRSSLVHYRTRDFLYNAVELPYKVYSAYPNTAHINDKLQVMCYYLKCHPSFHPSFKHWGASQPFDWRSDAYSIHFTHPDPPAFHNQTALRQSQGMFADIGRHIWNYGPVNKK